MSLYTSDWPTLNFLEPKSKIRRRSTTTIAIDAGHFSGRQMGSTWGLRVSPLKVGRRPPLTWPTFAYIKCIKNVSQGYLNLL